MSCFWLLVSNQGTNLMEIHHTLTSSIIICIHVPHFIQDAQPASKSIKWYFDIHGSVHQYVLTKMTNKMQLCRIIYCSLTALHVLSDIFAHNQEHLNCIYSFWYYSRMSLPAAAGSDIREAVNTVKILLIMSENIARNM